MTVHIHDDCADPMQSDHDARHPPPKKIRRIRKRLGQWYHSMQKLAECAPRMGNNPNGQSMFVNLQPLYTLLPLSPSDFFLP